MLASISRPQRELGYPLALSVSPSGMSGGLEWSAESQSGASYLSQEVDGGWVGARLGDGACHGAMSP